MRALHIVRRFVSSDLRELGTGYDLEHFKAIGTLSDHNFAIFQSKDEQKYKIVFKELTIILVPRLWNLLTWPIKNRKSFDIIIAQNPFIAGFISIIIGKLVKKPVIVSIHGYKFEVGKIQNSLKKIVCSNATMIRANSEIVKQTVISWGIDAKKIQIIEDRVDCTHFHPDVNGSNIRKQLGITKKMIISIGSLIEIKGFDTLLNAAKIVCLVDKEIKFVIIGEGPLKTDLIELVKNNNIEKNVIFMGFIPYDKTPEYLAASDLFVHTSNVESMGRVILEAEASGKPIIATNIGGIPEAVNENSALLIPPKNPKLLAESILNLLKDEKKTRLMGNEGRKIVLEKFEFWKQEEKLISFYEQVLHKFRVMT